MMYDVIVIGKGPAGLSAAIYTVRANLKTLVIGKSNSLLFKASKIENYFGFPEAISGSDLLKSGELQAQRLGADIINEEVLEIKKTDNFEVITGDKCYYAKAVLLASGQPQKSLNIDGLKEMEGMGVSYCTTCDGFFYKGLKVGVLGNKDFAIHEAKELKAFTNDITIYTNGKEMEYSGDYNKVYENFTIVNKPIQKLNGKDCLEEIYFTDGSFEKLDGLFIANDVASGIDFAKKLGVLTKGASILVDENQKTNIDGLFAAGDCTGGYKQIATAVGQGALAAGKIAEFIREKELINIQLTFS